MRSTLLAIAGSLSTLVALASPPGYRPPRRRYTAQREAYVRPPAHLVLGVNTAYYNGDLTSSPGDNNFKPGGSIGLLAPLSPHLSYGLDLTYFQLNAIDHNVGRGLKFAGNYEMLSTYVRYNLNGDRSMLVGQNHHYTPLLVFVQAGVGGLLYSPEATQRLGGRDVKLPDAAKAGYPGLAAVLPVGGGVTLKASEKVAFTLEALYYFTSTDLLDNISQTENSHRDGFATGSFKVEFSLGGSHKQKTLNQ